MKIESLGGRSDNETRDHSRALAGKPLRNLSSRGFKMSSHEEGIADIREEVAGIIYDLEVSLKSGNLPSTETVAKIMKALGDDPKTKK